MKLVAAWIALFLQAVPPSTPATQAPRASIEGVVRRVGSDEPFAHSAFGAEPLFNAIDQHREPAALELVERGQTNLNARNAQGDTLVHRAVETGMRHLLKALLAAGADPRARTTDGESPLHWAALSGHIVVAQRLLARGADARIKNRNGLSARDYASREGHAEIARLLERFDQ